jgi:DNA gyrase/topoisomerase IV subunit A
MLTNWLNGKPGALDEYISIHFEGFKGLIAGGDAAIGKWDKRKDGEYLVTELAPGTWTADYRTWLEKELAEGRIKDFTDTSTDKDVHIVIKGIDDTVLQKSLVFHAKKTNMHAFNHKGVITKYDTLNDILKEYADVRLALYDARRKHEIRALQEQLPYLNNIVRFIEDQISDKPTIELRKKTRSECDAILTQHGFACIDDIMKLPVSSFTAEMIAKHKKELATIRDKIAQLETTTASQLWLDDLQQLEIRQV